jgi:hypothetical protein
MRRSARRRLHKDFFLGRGGTGTPGFALVPDSQPPACNSPCSSSTFPVITLGSTVVFNINQPESTQTDLLKQRRDIAGRQKREPQNDFRVFVFSERGGVLGRICLQQTQMRLVFSKEQVDAGPSQGSDHAGQ